MRLVFHDLLQDPDMPAWRIWLSVLRDLRGSFLQEHLASLREGLSMTRHQLPSSALLRRGPVFWCAIVLTWILSWITFRSFDLSGGHAISVLGGFGIVMGALGLGIAVVGLAIAVLTRGWPRDRFGPTPPRE
jgi:phosphatidylglycerophosphate synthase